MLQIRTATNQTWDVDFRPDGAVSLNNEPFDWNITPVEQNHYHILFKNQSYTAELLEADYATKVFRFKINGQVVELQAKDRFDLLLDKLGMSNTTAQKVNELKAPMPGLIVAIRIEPGQAVQKGDPLLVLEAMKMENILKAPGEGTIASVKVQLRDNVTKGQVLIQFS